MATNKKKAAPKVQEDPAAIKTATGKMFRIDINERSHRYADPTYLVFAETRSEAIVKAIGSHKEKHPKQEIDDLRVVSETDATIVP